MSDTDMSTKNKHSNIIKLISNYFRARAKTREVTSSAIFAIVSLSPYVKLQTTNSP